MKIVGLITEYNPFHLGHRYHIQKAKALTGADYCIAVVSGNYVQRGEPSFIDKYTKTSIAVENGIDLVIELPFCFATASAEYFAYAAITILDKLNCVDYICFGSECGKIQPLKVIAEVLSDEPDDFKISLRENLRNGLSFPVARTQALISYFDNIKNSGNRISPSCTMPDNDLSWFNEQLLNSPNNILGIEYLKALKKRGSSIKAVTFGRVNAAYHETGSKNMLYSASALRANLNPCSNNFQNLDTDNAQRQTELTMDDILNELTQITPLYKHIAFAHTPETDNNIINILPIVPNDFSVLLGEKLLAYRLENIGTQKGHAVNPIPCSSIFGISDDLSNRIRNLSLNYTDFADFIMKIKTKDLSYTTVSRALIHILLNINSDFIDTLMNHDICDFIRVLGVTKKGTALLNKISKCSSLSILTNISSAGNLLSELPEYNKTLFQKWLFADELYRMVCMNKYHVCIPTEYTRKFICD